MSLPIVKLLSQRVSTRCNNLELNPNKTGKNQGFSLIELLLTLVLLITLTSIAVPLISWRLKTLGSQRSP